ncbi:MAG: glycoside hydrolase family 127 protein, partial [Chloroflexi bacterium]|nr:glycoside hydrolase family 127 protein [Chloroflexota bacterium]
MSNQTRPAAMVIDTSHSPHARLRPVPLTAVTLADDFWAPKLRINREVTLLAQYDLLEETGRINNFRRAAFQNSGPAGSSAEPPFAYCGRYYNDSDVYKWLEAVAWTMAAGAAPALAQAADTVIDAIAGAQQPDGYLNTYFTFDRATERWSNLRDTHELYCAGHFIQAAVAHHRATGSDRLLDVARRLADHIGRQFGPPETGRQPGTPGHEEIEMALVELARETGDAQYRQQAQYFLDARGHDLIGGRAYHQDHQPFRELDRLAGHAVRAVYLCAGATDLYAETGEPALRQTLDRLWHRMTTRQMYISGALGSRYLGEAFGADYELPNERAYAETCAAIGSVMWNWRMLMLDGATIVDARYADLIETTLYNAVLPGFSLDGQHYFYENPLASTGTHRRQPWFDCACCPPNIARLLASLPGYFYSLSDATDLWVHLYASGTAHIVLPDGRAVGLTQYTRYPWAGDVTLIVESQGPFTLHLRIPGWCTAGAAIAVNEQPVDDDLVPGSYAAVRCNWQPGDVVRLHLPLPVQRVACHPYVTENAGRVALMRGPILYCVEGADNPGLDPRDLLFPAGAEFTPRFQPNLLGGVVTLGGQAAVVPPGDAWADRLYRPVDAVPAEMPGRSVEVTAIPYY